MPHSLRGPAATGSLLLRARRAAFRALAGLGAAFLALAPRGASAAAPNLVGNPSFESGTNGWRIYNGTSIAQVGGGAHGSFALEVRGENDLTTFGINDSPNWITTVPEPGTRYRFTAKVRSVTPAGSARLQVREYLDGVQQGVTLKTTPVPLSSVWQTIAAEFVTSRAGSTLDFQVLDIPVAGNETFLVDEVSIVIVVPDRAPVVTVDAEVTVEEGGELGLSVTAEDPDGDPITSLAADLSGLPPGANARFTADGTNAAGLFTWTPTFDDAGGPYVVRFFAGNVLAGVASTSIDVANVDRPPIVTAPPIVAARDSAALVVEVSVTDPDGDAIGALVADLSALPVGHDAVFGASADAREGMLRWTPRLGASGEFSIRFRAANGAAGEAVTVLSIARLEHPPMILAPSLVATNESERVEVSVAAFDPDGDPFRSLTADLSGLPPWSGATFTTTADHASGVLAWTPSHAHAGVYRVSFTADNGEVATASLDVEVRNVDRAPVVSAPARVTAFEGEPLRVVMTAGDPDGEPLALLSADLGALPAGHDARLEPEANGTAAALVWTPRAGDQGSYALVFRAANALLGTAPTTIVVRPPNRAPIADLSVSPEWTATPMLVTASARGASDPDGDPLTYRFDFGEGIVVGPQASPVAHAMLATPGVHTVTVHVADAFGASDTATFRVRAHLGNLCTNPGLENTSVGWTAYGGAAIARVAGAGRTGSFAFEATRASGAAWGFNDAPDWVPLTAGPGRRYRVVAWARSVAHRGQAYLRVQEFLGITQRGATVLSPRVTLSGEWQLLSADVVVTTPGTRLDMKILYDPVGANEKFQFDDFQVLLLPVGDEPPSIMAPAAVVAIAGQPLAIPVRAADPDGTPVATIGASLAALPPGHDARFTPAADGAGGTLTWTPRASDVSPAPYRIVVTASNALATSVPIEIVVASAPLPNRCANPGFETSASGWSPYVAGTALRRVNSGRTGHFGVLLTHPSSTGWGLNDERDIVSNVAGPGRTYRFSAWVRSATSAGKVRMRIQEFLGTAQKGATTESPEIALGPQWQRLAVSYTTTTPGTRLDMKILDAPLAAGEAFLVDDVEVLLMPEGDRPPALRAPESTPATPLQPMTVSVAVADPDGDPIPSLAADLSAFPAGSGATFTPGPGNGTGVLSWTPAADHARAAPYVVTFTASNSKTALASTAIHVSAVSAPNLCVNSGFESGTTGWGTYGAVTLRRVSGGRTGAFALRMSTTGSTSFGTDDSPNVVASVPAAGDRYRFSAWVRSDSSTSPVRLRIYEFAGGVQLGSVTDSYEIPLTTTWQRVIVDYTALATGSTLSLRVVMFPSAAAQSFVMDDVLIQRLPAGAALIAGGTPAIEDLGTGAAGTGETGSSLAPALAFGARFGPNPMRGEGTLAFVLPSAGPVRVELFDPAGRRVRTLLDRERLEAGRHTLPLSARDADLAAGVYFYRVAAPGTGHRSGRVVVLP